MCDQGKEKAFLEKEVDNINQNYQNISKKRIWKNVIIVGLSFLLTYTSLSGLSSIQSSLHRDQGMGTTSISCRYVAYTVSCLFLSPAIIRVCGHKWTIVISLGTFLFWNIANGFGIWATMVPASIVSGAFAASLWIAKGSYLAELAVAYAQLADINVSKVCNLFFGAFFAIFNTSFVIADVMTSTLLRHKPLNETVLTHEQIQEYCGMKDCPWKQNNSTLIDEIPRKVVWTLVGVFTGLNVISILICIVFLDQLYNVVNLPQQGEIKDEILQVILSSFKLQKDYKIWLLVPLNWFSSILQTYRTAEFTGSWVACALGIWMIGYVLLPRSIISPITAYFTGFISKYTGNIFLVLFADIICFSVLVFLILSLGLGVSESILDVLVISAYGSLFPCKTAASYAIYNVVWSICASATYGYSYVTCSDVKLYIVIFLLFLATMCYIPLELNTKCGKQNIGGNNKLNGECAHVEEELVELNV